MSRSRVLIPMIPTSSPTPSQSELAARQRALEERNHELEQAVARLEKAAAERQRAEAQSHDAERQLRLVTEHAGVLLVHCDKDCRIRYASKAYAARFGLTPEQMVGKQSWEILGQQAFERVRSHIMTALSGQRDEFEMEVPYDRLGPRWMHVVNVPEYAPDGSVIGFVGVMTDVTTRKRTEIELEHARDEALAASRAKDDFLAALSHELRTPLNPVLLLASDAADNPELPADVRSVFETIRKNIDLEARLIDDLLNLTRISRGKLALDMHTVDVHAILKDSLANVSVDVAQKHLSLRLDLNAHLHTVMGDAVRLQQVFWNVLKNAVKFTPEGGSISITTHSLPESDRMQIIIADTGIGMAPSEVTRVFDAFTQGGHATEGGSHRFGGLGLGLAISRMLIQNHSGRIEAQSAGPGQGSTFTVYLPLAPQVPETLPIQSPEDHPSSAASVPVDPASVRILLVEDHEPTRTSLAQLLSRRHYQVATAGTAAEALAAAANTCFDLLISDIGLPDGNGNDLMTTLAATQGIKGIALTGYGMERDVIRTREAGFHTHLTKPIRMESLERAIRDTLADTAPSSRNNPA
jgi:PAS domain S-box-containing protein